VSTISGESQIRKVPAEVPPSADLWLQDAGSDTAYLLEALISACQGATGGGGLFAWTSAAGSTALFDNRDFARLLRRSGFDLIVGIDSITDERAIEALKSATGKYPKLKVRIFLHGQRSLFHPKLSWFSVDGGLRLIVGSGNLTMGGLKANWEAFTIVTLSQPRAQEILDQIAVWIEQWQDCLLPLDHPDVEAQAKQNTGNERSFKRQRRPRERQSPRAVVESTVLLVAEIPKSSDRASQANFNRDNYEHFFGAQIGSTRQILLYHVRSDGSVDPVESRPSVQRKSRNYSFELNALKDLPSNSGRAIGVFLRLETGLFLYVILIPTTSGYGAVSSFLGSHATGPARELRRYRTEDVDSLRQAWPDSPLWKAASPEL
jgi:hypothetical protein